MDEKAGRKRPSAVEELLQSQHGLDSLPIDFNHHPHQATDELMLDSEPMEFSLVGTSSASPLPELNALHGESPTAVSTVEHHPEIPLLLHEATADHATAMLPMSELSRHSVNVDDPSNISPAHLLSTPLVDPIPVTVSPSEISKFVEVSHLSPPAPSRVSEMFSAQPDDACEPEQPNTDDAAPASRGSTPQLTPTGSGNMSEESATQEYIITLPFASNERPFYVQKIEAAKQAVAQFTGAGLVAAADEAPKASLKYQVEALFTCLFDMCDLPSNLEAESMHALSPKDAQKFCVGTNSKFAFVWELLYYLRDVPTKVLLISRSPKTRELLHKILQVEGYGVTTTSITDLADGQAASPIHLVLGLSDQEPLDPIADFDVVIGFDYKFKYSKTSQHLAAMNDTDSSKNPVIINLCLLYAIDHIDFAINKEMAPLQRMAALAVAVVRSRTLIVHPDTPEDLPHQVARIFADQIKEPNPNFYWSSQPIPEDVFDFDVPQMGTTIMKNSDEEIDRGLPLVGRKRKTVSLDLAFASSSHLT
jgi:hypothetical protein